MMNQRHLMAQLAGRASVSLQTQLFFKARDIITDGLIMSVRSNGILVYAPEFGIEYMIRLISLEYKAGSSLIKKGEEWKYNQVDRSLRNRLNGVIS